MRNALARNLYTYHERGFLGIKLGRHRSSQRTVSPGPAPADRRGPERHPRADSSVIPSESASRGTRFQDPRLWQPPLRI